MRTFKRDKSGRFARVGRALAKRDAKKKADQLLRIDKRWNKQMSKEAVRIGLVNKKNSKILLKNANTKAKARHKARKNGIL